MSEKSEANMSTEVIEIDHEAVTAVTQDEDMSQQSSSKELCRSKGFVRQRNYILNDVAALKKKFRQENREADIVIGREAKDLSNITVPMRASFFEFVKAFFVQDLLSDPSILEISNAECVKASTESHGEANVEYSLELTFLASQISHTVKLTAYTTTSLKYTTLHNNIT